MIRLQDDIPIGHCTITVEVAGCKRLSLPHFIPEDIAEQVLEIHLDLEIESTAR